MNQCHCATPEYPGFDPDCSQHGNLARTPGTDRAAVSVTAGGGAEDASALRTPVFLQHWLDLPRFVPAKAGRSMAASGR
jgi:hypothetical protein